MEFKFYSKLLNNMKVELPELENIYHSICTWDYYKDLSSNEDVLEHMEEDNFNDNIKSNQTQDLSIVKYENVPIKFSNSEEYIRIFYNLFLKECKSQIGRSRLEEVSILN